MKIEPLPHPMPPFAFLTSEDLRVMQQRLRGVHSVEVRQIGGSPDAGAEVVAHLEAEGLEVVYRVLERMTPPPSCRLVFRYHGTQAELTIAPEVPH